jgi:hypothetical protein
MMDPITTAIIAALALGVAGGVQEVGKEVVVDAYQALKTTLRQKLGAESEVVDAVEKLEKKPDSEGRRATLMVTRLPPRWPVICGMRL